jgi:hypothetical protein
LRDCIREETCRSNGTSMETIVGRLNRRLKGWYGGSSLFPVGTGGA